MHAGFRVTANRRAVLSGFTVVASTAGIRFGFGVFVPHLDTELAGQVSAIGAAFTAHWLVFTVSAPLAWRVFLRLGTRAMFRAGGLLCGLGFAGLALTSSPVHAVIAFGVVVGVGTHGIGLLSAYQPVLDTIAPAHRDRAFGLIACGSPVGTAAYPAVAALAVDTVGWRAAALVVGMVVLLMTWGAAWVAPRPPASTAATGTPSGTGSGGRASRAGSGLWRDPTFVLLAAAMFLALLVQTAVPFAVPLWAESVGLDGQQLATAFTVLGTAGVLGRLLLASRPPITGLRVWAAVPAAVTAVAGCAVAATVSDPLWLYVAAALFGFGSPVFGALFAVAAAACFPPDRFPRVTGALLVPVGLGAGLAPLLLTAAIDHDVPLGALWATLAGAALLTAALFVTAELTSPQRPRPRHGPATA